jgi:hypothetical protein
MTSILRNSMSAGEIPSPLGLVEDVKGIDIEGRKVDSAYIPRTLGESLDTLRSAGYGPVSFRDYLGLLVTCPMQLDGQSTLLKEAVVFNTGGQAGILVRDSPLVMAILEGGKRDEHLYEASEYIAESRKSGEVALAKSNPMWMPTRNHPELAAFFAYPAPGPDLEKFLVKNGIEQVVFSLKENIPRLDSTCPVGQLSVSSYQNFGKRMVLVTSYGLLPKGEEHDPVHRTWYGGMERRYAMVGNPKQKPDLINSTFRMRGIRAAA